MADFLRDRPVANPIAGIHRLSILLTRGKHSGFLL
jgi:hypothetical protein